MLFSHIFSCFFTLKNGLNTWFFDHLWNFFMSYSEFYYVPFGISLCPFWNFIMSLLEFYYVPFGILLCPYWNFFMSLLEFYYVPIGILLCPLILANRMFTGFAAPRNQVSNQVSNQVYNQAINQGAIDGLIYHFIVDNSISD